MDEKVIEKADRECRVSICVIVNEQRRREMDI